MVDYVSFAGNATSQIVRSGVTDMMDLFGREINYMRVSVTDLCNLRCRYCMPASGVRKMEHNDIMSEEEIITVIEAASELGINKIRFTGGEPLLKKNVASICRKTSRVPGINEICLTTNGILLPHLAVELRDAGVCRINISLDTLKPERYSYITRGGSLHEAMLGIDAAIKAGFKVKLNTVMISGFNDDEIPDIARLTHNMDIDIRFIELMPILEDFSTGKFISSQKVLDTLPELEPLGTMELLRMFQFKGARESTRN